MKAKQKFKYLHTINGEPGHFQGGQVCFSVVTRPIPLCDSLQEIRRQQKASAKYRTKNGWDNSSTLGYRKIAIS